MMKFLKDQASSIFMTASCLFIYWLVFILTDLDSYGFYLGLGPILIIFALVLVSSWVKYKREEDLRRKNKELRKDLLKLKEDQSDFYKDMSDYFILWIHQIKTPITAARLRVKNTQDKKMDQIINEIENYTDLAMSYLKLQEPDRDMDFSLVGLDEIINPILKKYSWSFIESSTKLVYEPIEKEVLTDPNWTQVMVEQLVNNALKYARGKTIKIYFSGNKLYIEDTGKGIGAQDLEMIFKKGYSGFNGRLNEESSGLGLYIVDKIAKRLGQPVGVKSEPGKGTSFSISFHDKDLTKL